MIQKSKYITIGQFDPRDIPDRPDWPNAPLLTPEERDALLDEIFKEHQQENES